MGSHWGTLASKKNREIVFPNNLSRKTSSEWGIIYFCSLNHLLLAFSYNQPWFAKSIRSVKCDY